MRKFVLLSLFILFLFPSFLMAQLSLPRIFANNMVMQRNTNIRIWGTASPNADVSVQLGDNKLSVSVDQDARWSLALPPMIAGGPYQLTVTESLKGQETSKIVFSNVMIGDVWFASGQSNMEFMVKQAKNYSEEKLNAKFPNIRVFEIPHAIKTAPQSDIASGQWIASDSSTVGKFSAAAFFFARQIHLEQHIPIGIIESTWGGTPVEAWTSREMLMSSQETKHRLDSLSALGINEASMKKDIDNQQLFWNTAMDSRNGLKLGFTKLKYDDAAWTKIQMPALFRELDPHPFEAILWLRKTIDLPASMAGKKLKINLGQPEILYDLYLNGKTICEKKWNADKIHSFQLPSGVLKAGQNILCMRLDVMWGGGGMNPPADSLYITDGKTKISLAGEWKYIRGVEPQLPQIMNYHKYPTYLYNGMIHPVLPYSIKGFLWYQGEENASNPLPYRELFPLMINDWRIQWQQGNLPFIYVQLANFMKRQSQPSNSNWALLREAQAGALKLPNTAMATIIDIGEGEDIHPKNKQDVGKRLALAAKHLAYGEDIAYSGPTMDSYQIEGQSIRVHFKHCGHNLIIKDGSPIKGFAIAGKDRVFHWAEAKIEGEYIVLKSSEVAAPIAVRYAWADNPDCNLYNQEGLPAVPFRTDDW